MYTLKFVVWRRYCTVKISVALCPIPFGDGIVDVLDLIVFTKHLLEKYLLAESVE